MARGNVQATYDGSAWSWAFAEHQTDYLGKTGGANEHIDGVMSLDGSGTIDLFGWNGASSPNNSLGINISQTNDPDYGNIVTEGLKNDWGAIPDLVAKYGVGWRTLTVNEWGYMFYTRPNTTVNGVENARYTRATIIATPGDDISSSDPGLHGMLIFPDDFVVPEGLSANFTWGAHINSRANVAETAQGRWNVFAKMTAGDWALLEAVGCVFLPAGGYRTGATIYGSDIGGYYWSSSPHSNATYAYGVGFSASYANSQDFNYRYLGRCVRLARDF